MRAAGPGEFSSSFHEVVLEVVSGSPFYYAKFHHAGKECCVSTGEKSKEKAEVVLDRLVRAAKGCVGDRSSWTNRKTKSEDAERA